VCRLPAAAVKVGIEAAGHYHRPLLGSAVWPAGWLVLELSPARVAEQRRVQGRRRVKTDAIDLEAPCVRASPAEPCPSDEEAR
jgi:transposase